jgi:glucose-6-phosphate 1-epimerase
MVESMQTAEALNENFGLPGVLGFDTHGDLVRALVTLPGTHAQIYLQGAHLAHWQPAETDPVLFVSSQSEFAPGKAIRGGVPVCFPWFGPDQQNRAGGRPGPSHGFARTSEWTLAFAALEPAEGEDAGLHLTFTLGPNAASRAVGYNDFRVAYEIGFSGRTLRLRVSVANTGAKPLVIEEALHSYFAVDDVRATPLEGLGGAQYLDKTDGMYEKSAPAGIAPLSGWTDRVYPANTSEVSIHDGTRTIVVAKENSATTVLWNPWDEAARSMADLGNDEWPGFVCVETANAGADAVSIEPGTVHTMAAEITVQG